MALDENKAPQDEKDAKQENHDSFVSSEQAQELFRTLCISAHSGQAEYFLNVYWDKYGNQNKNEIFGIFQKFVETNSDTKSRVTYDEVL